MYGVDMHVVKVRSTYYFILLMWGPCLGADQSLGVSLLWCGLPCGPWSLRIPSLLQGSSQEFISSHIPHGVPFHMPFPMSLDFYYYFFFPFAPPSPGSYCLLLSTGEPRCGLPWLQCWCETISTDIGAVWGSTQPLPTQGTLQPPVAKTQQFAPNTDAYSSAL